MAATKATVTFEVFGRVQGVFFRKHTKRKACELRLVGWVMNTKQNTVSGCAQGSPDTIHKMKHWLQYDGSPKSRIDKCVFTKEKEIENVDFESFEIRR